MIVFSKEFGSDDPFVDAVQGARWMSENDAHSFCPHIGLASGKVIVGYVGTPLKYNCSVFGAPVALAALCVPAPGRRRPVPVVGSCDGCAKASKEGGLAVPGLGVSSWYAAGRGLASPRSHISPHVVHASCSAGIPAPS